MTPQEFCHWLQGFFDGLNSPEALNEVQTHLMKEKLKSVVNAPQLYEWRSETFTEKKYDSETMEKYREEKMKKHMEHAGFYTNQPSLSWRLKKQEPPIAPLTPAEDPYVWFALD